MTVHQHIHSIKLQINAALTWKKTYTKTLYFESDLPTQVVSITVGQIMKEGDSWAGTDKAGLEERRKGRADSRSEMDTVERREEDSCCYVDHTLLSQHISYKHCPLLRGLELMEKIRCSCQDSVLCDRLWLDYDTNKTCCRL